MSTLRKAKERREGLASRDYLRLYEHYTSSPGMPWLEQYVERRRQAAREEQYRIELARLQLLARAYDAFGS